MNQNQPKPKRTHPWRAPAPTKEQQAAAELRRANIIPTYARMGVKAAK